MRIGILSDVHANLEALDAVLADVEQQRCDALVCLGDFVGYGPDPIECVARLRGRLRAAVVGNHDRAAVGGRPIDDFNAYAQEAIIWTQEHLDAETRDYLLGLPERDEVEGLLLVHGSPRQPVDEYVVDGRTARASFVADPFRIAFVGHTHVPAMFEEVRHRVRLAEWLPGIPKPLRSDHRYIINVGSVGQPRDSNRDAAYVTFDAAERSVTLHRAPYDLAATQRKMEAALLPVPLIERLAVGR
jgi:predicted phosphodiesterase